MAIGAWGPDETRVPDRNREQWWKEIQEAEIRRDWRYMPYNVRGKRVFRYMPRSKEHV